MKHCCCWRRPSARRAARVGTRSVRAASTSSLARPVVGVEHASWPLDARAEAAVQHRRNHLRRREGWARRPIDARGVGALISVPRGRSSGPNADQDLAVAAWGECMGSEEAKPAFRARASLRELDNATRNPIRARTSASAWRSQRGLRRAVRDSCTQCRHAPPGMALVGSNARCATECSTTFHSRVISRDQSIFHIQKMATVKEALAKAIDNST